MRSQVVIPHVTESYSSSADPEEDAIPLCTIKTFPTQVNGFISQPRGVGNDNTGLISCDLRQPEHCVAWAKSKFEEYFRLQPQLVRDLQAILQKQQLSPEIEVEAWLDALPEEQVGHFLVSGTLFSMLTPQAICTLLILVGSTSRLRALRSMGL
jgi:hypothetical protein